MSTASGVRALHRDGALGTYPARAADASSWYRAISMSAAASLDGAVDANKACQAQASSSGAFALTAAKIWAEILAGGACVT